MHRKNHKKKKGYYRSRFGCKVKLPIGNYQITFDSTNGNSAYRNDGSLVKNAQIEVFGYAESYARSKPYSTSQYKYKGMFVRVGYD